MVDKGKWLNGFIFHLGIVIAISILMFTVITGYNAPFGNSCSMDTDCRYICSASAVNGEYILLRYPSMSVSCFGFHTAICEDGRCAVLSEKTLVDAEQYDRLKNESDYVECYGSLIDKAKEINDSSICNQIKEKYRENCINALK